MLIPNILSYIEKANLARANANAKEVYTLVMEYWSESVANGDSLSEDTTYAVAIQSSLKDKKNPQWLDRLGVFLAENLPNDNEFVSVTFEDGYPTRVTWASYKIDTMVGCYPTPAVGRNTKGNVGGNSVWGKDYPKKKPRVYGYAPNTGDDE